MSEMVKPNDKERLLIDSYFSQAQKAVADIKIRWAERMDFGNDLGLRIGLALPAGLPFDGNEALTLRELAITISGVEKYEIVVSMTPVTGEGQLLSLDWLLPGQISDDAQVIYKTAPASKIPKWVLPSALVVIIACVAIATLIRNAALEETPTAAQEKPRNGTIVQLVNTDTGTNLPPPPLDPPPPPITPEHQLLSKKLSSMTYLKMLAYELERQGRMAEARTVRDALSKIEKIPLSPAK
ncbi:MAG: hypothetical protein K2X81_24545 [Candidatus Obscuribacterales bacterium]|nr:hypothetical protein [Candidatus Obscuribacterales bacterium]